MATPLLQTKLYVPLARPELVSRPRLIERLDAALTQKLTLVSAPAGFGKTALLSEWVAVRRQSDAPIPVAWLSLDDGDNDLVRFLTYLVAALQAAAQTVDPSIGADLLSVLRSPQLPALEVLLTLLINDLAALSLEGNEAQRPYVLVLDDYHVIHDRSIHQALAFLLDHLPPAHGLHLVLLTREDPPLPLPRLRVQQQITHIRAQDLRFTVEEAALFFSQTMGLHLDAQDVAVLDSRTEGWIAGLQMAALTMQNVEDTGAFIRAFTGDDRYVVDYLVTEVLVHQPPRIKTFLLQTSVLQRFNASLCDAVRFGVSNSPTEHQDGREILAHLERANLFLIPLDRRREWYRYHHLFADLLRYQLRAQGGDAGESVLHQRAAHWYEQHGLIDDALSHYLLAKDTPAASALVAAHAMPAFKRGEIHSAQEWLKELPADAIRTSPRLCCDMAWICTVNDDYPRLVEYVNAARAALPGSGWENDAAFIAEWTVLQAFAAFLLGETQTAFSLGQQALDQLPYLSGFVREANCILLADIYTSTDVGHVSEAVACGREAMAAGLSSSSITTGLYGADRLTRALVLQGQYQAAEAVFQETFEAVRERGLVYAPILVTLDLKYALVLYELNRLAQAERFVRDGLSLSQKLGAPGSELWCRLLLRRGQWAQGYAVDAMDPLTTDEAIDAMLRELAGQAAQHPASAQFAALRAQLWTFEKQLARAEQWASSSGLSLGDEPPFGQMPFYLALAQIHLALGTALPELLALLERLHQLASRKGSVQQTVQILLLQTLTLDKLERSTAARAALKEALSLAEPTGMVRSFLDHGPPLIGLLSRTEHPYASELLAVVKPSAVDLPPPPGVLGEALNERETEVLRLFAAGLTNAAIASRLFVSLNTVKWYAKNIYRKLDVHSRAEAISKGYELNLLS